MANNKFVRLSRNSPSTNGDMEESLVEIRDEEPSTKQILSELSKMKGQKRLLNLVKYSVGILLVLVFASFLFAYFIHQKELENTNEDVKMEASELKISLDTLRDWQSNQTDIKSKFAGLEELDRRMQEDIKKLSANYNNMEIKIAQLETDNRNTVEITNNLTSRQDSLDLKLGRSKNITHKHFKMVEEKWNEMYEVIDALNTANSTQPLSIADYMKQSFVYEWNITSIQRPTSSPSMWRNREVFKTEIKYSEVFTFWFNVHAKLKLEMERYKTTVSLQFVDDNSTTNTPSTEKIPKITYIIQNKDGISEDKTLIGQCKFNQTFQSNQTFYDVSLVSVWWNTDLIDDMSVKIVVEPRQLITNYFSNNGILFWRVANYKKQKRLLLDGKIAYVESPYFYTSPRGYKMQILLKIYHQQILGFVVSVYCGEYDSSLPKIASQRIYLTLFNQENPTKNFEIHEEINSRDMNLLTAESDSGTYLSKTSYIEASGFVKDDSLLFKFVIEPLATLDESDYYNQMLK